MNVFVDKRVLTFRWCDVVKFSLHTILCYLAIIYRTLKLLYNTAMLVSYTKKRKICKESYVLCNFFNEVYSVLKKIVLIHNIGFFVEPFGSIFVILQCPLESPLLHRRLIKLSYFSLPFLCRFILVFKLSVRHGGTGL